MVDTSKPDKELKDRLEYIRRLGRPFYMERVPIKTIKEFKEIAKDSCSDYGMTFKAMVDCYKREELERIKDIRISKLEINQDIIFQKITEILLPKPQDEPKEVSGRERQKLRKGGIDEQNSKSNKKV